MTNVERHMQEDFSWTLNLVDIVRRRCRGGRTSGDGASPNLQATLSRVSLRHPQVLLHVDRLPHWFSRAKEEMYQWYVVDRAELLDLFAINTLVVPRKSQGVISAVKPVEHPTFRRAPELGGTVSALGTSQGVQLGLLVLLLVR